MDADFLIAAKKLGAELQKKRKKLELEVGIAAKKSRISESYIEAIENGNLDILPQGFYLKNFIKEYCKFLGANDIWSDYNELFDAQIEAEKILDENQETIVPEKNLMKQQKQYRPVNNKPTLIIAGILLLLAIIALFSFRRTISSEVKSDDVNQLRGGTAQIIEQKKAEEAAIQKAEEEKASKLAEERAKSEEAEHAQELAKEEQNSQESETVQTVEEKPAKLAVNELYIFAPEQKITIKASQGQAIVFEGDIMPGKSVRFRVEKNAPLRVRYENPNKTEVIFGDKEFKPLHPSSEGRSRYYWSDGEVTFTGKR